MVAMPKVSVALGSFSSPPNLHYLALYVLYIITSFLMLCKILYKHTLKFPHHQIVSQGSVRPAVAITYSLSILANLQVAENWFLVGNGSIPGLSETWAQTDADAWAHADTHTHTHTLPNIL